VEYMVGEATHNIEGLNDLNIKILDPACGGGYFLTSLFKRLLIIAKEKNIENPEEHIVKFNIFGCDIDPLAVKISCIELYRISGVLSKNIVVKDFLMEYSGEYDVIIGNPPYMGHKLIKGNYRDELKKLYSEVFYDKGDLSYCFIKRAIELLKDRGKLVFLTSRYILEAMNGDGIRKYIIKNGALNIIIDFYGIRLVKGAGVDNIILSFIKGQEYNLTELYRLLPLASGKGFAILESLRTNDSLYYDHRRAKLEISGDEPFSFLSQAEIKLLSKLKGKRLYELCQSFQGIITGCDKAFVMTKAKAQELGLETSLLKPWIKSKSIGQLSIEPTDKVLIYSEEISNQQEYIKVMEHLKGYYDKLIIRRECKNGSKPWYRLQWGRNKKIFEEKKIIYPYKSPSNRFALDEGSYFSADIYCMKIKEDCMKETTYEFLLGLLNSSLYEFYIKAISKKLGENMYDYYPNKIMTLIIPKYFSELHEAVLSMEVFDRDRIDDIIYKWIDITEEEIEIINIWCKK
jgi:adenine-specific DNA-methyltransferase